MSGGVDGGATDLDPRILDVSHTAKVGLQATLTSNHTHPGHVVLGKGAVLQPGILTSATVTLTVVGKTRYFPLFCLIVCDTDPRIYKRLPLSP